MPRNLSSDYRHEGNDSVGRREKEIYSSMRHQQSHAVKGNHHAHTTIKIATTPSSNLSRDRSNETHATGESSGLYSFDMLREANILGSDVSEDEGGIPSVGGDYIVSISKDYGEDIMDEVDLDMSVGTVVTKNKSMSSTSPLRETSFDIKPSSSWVEDKPFDEESILNLSDIGGDENQDKYRYSKDPNPVKEYLFPYGFPGNRKMMSPRAVNELIQDPPSVTGETRTARSASLRSKNGAPVATVTWASSTDSERDQSHKQATKRQWRMQMCILAICFVIAVVIAGVFGARALSNKNDDVDYQAAAASSSEGAQSNTTSTTFAPSLRVPAAPGAAPGTTPSESPSTAPVDEIPWLDEVTGTTGPPDSVAENPTELPAGASTEPITSPPNGSVTGSPNNGEDPTAESPVCTTRVTVYQKCFFSISNVIVVDFENCDAQDKDWIGIYSDGSEFQDGDSGKEFVTNNWVTWAWSCGDRECDGSPRAGSFAFPVNEDEPAYDLLTLRAYLLRNTPNAPPFEVIAKSIPFVVTSTCGN
jgi:hypothetical protein